MICIVSSSLKEPRLTLTPAMKERLTQTQIMTVLTGVSGLEKIERMEADCEVSEVTKVNFHVKNRTFYFCLTPYTSVWGESNSQLRFKRLP